MNNIERKRNTKAMFSKFMQNAQAKKDKKELIKFYKNKKAKGDFKDE